MLPLTALALLGRAPGRRARLPAGVPAAGGAVRRNLHRAADFVHRRLHRLGAAGDRHPGAAQRHPLRNPHRQLVGGRSLQRRALPDLVDHHRLPVRLPDLPLDRAARAVHRHLGRGADHRQRHARLHDRHDRPPERHEAGHRRRPPDLRLAVLRPGDVHHVLDRQLLARRRAAGAAAGRRAGAGSALAPAPASRAWPLAVAATLALAALWPAFAAYNQRATYNPKPVHARRRSPSAGTPAPASPSWMPNYMAPDAGFNGVYRAAAGTPAHRSR